MKFRETKVDILFPFYMLLALSILHTYMIGVYAVTALTDGYSIIEVGMLLFLVVINCIVLRLFSYVMLHIIKINRK